MGEIVNLRIHRRRRDRTVRADQAAENRARHGRTGGEKERDRLLRDHADRTLDAARMDDVSPDEPGSTGG